MKSHFGFKFNSDTIDPYLYGVAIIALASLIQDFKVKPEDINIDEHKIKDTFLYCFSVNNLIAYIGRDAGTNEVIYLFVDESRFKWAELEGFYSKNFGRKEVFEQIGAIRKLETINDLTNFLSRKPFKAIGPYLKSTAD